MTEHEDRRNHRARGGRLRSRAHGLWERVRGRIPSRPRDRFAGTVRDAGMATAEYAIVTLAAAGFAGVLIVLLRSDEVRGLLLGLVRGALAP